MANEWKDIGREIRDAVLDAVESGDYSQLNRRITGSVGAAIDEVNERLNGRRTGGNYQRNPNYRNPNSQNPYAQRRYSYAVPPEKAIKLYQEKPKGGASGMVLTILGGILLGVFGMGLFIVTLVGLFLGWPVEFSVVSGVLMPFAIGSAVLLGIGCKQRGAIKRFRQYLAAIQGKHYCAISDLAQKSGKKESYVLRDLKNMISRNWFYQAHIDDEGKTLLLTDAMYQQYRELKYQRQQQAEEQRERNAETAEEKLYRETAAQGRKYITAIRRANDDIPGEVVSQKLYRLEEIVSRIFEQVKEQPQQIPELRRFFDYYMPTTLKLVETYQMLDSQSIAGQNIETSKREIERTLDTINLAFENLFDSLFAHTAVDITSDITVLKNLLRQEGLTDKDFA